MRRKQTSGFSFDILAPEVKLNILGKAVYPTKVGILMSLACLCIFITASSFTFISYLDTTRPKISQEIKNLSEEPLIDFIQDKHFPILFFYDQEVIPVNSTDLPTFAHVFLLKSTFYESPIVGEPEEVVYEKFDLVPCSALLAQDNNATFAYESTDVKETERWRNLAYCFDNRGGSMTLGGERGRKTYEVVELKILPCIMGADCKSEEALSTLSYSIANPTAVSNFGIKKSPISHDLKDENYEYLNFDTCTVHKMNLMRAEIYEDQGFLSETTRTSQYTVLKKMQYAFRSRNRTQITCTEEEVDLLSCVPYFVQELSVSNSLLRVEREYKGVVDSLGEVGGILDLIFVVFHFIYGFYNSGITQRALVKSIYGVEQPEKVKGNKEGKVGDKIEKAEYKRALNSVLNRSMDIVAIAKEVNRVRFLCDFLFTTDIDAKIPAFLLMKEGIPQKEDKPLPSPSNLVSSSVAVPFIPTKMNRVKKRVKPILRRMVDRKKEQIDSNIDSLSIKMESIGNDTLEYSLGPPRAKKHEESIFAKKKSSNQQIPYTGSNLVDSKKEDSGMTELASHNPYGLTDNKFTLVSGLQQEIRKIMEDQMKPKEKKDSKDPFEVYK